MIAVSLPNPGPFGWGRCGASLTAAIQSLTRVLVAEDDDIPREYTDPMLHAIQGVNMLPLRPNAWTTGKSVGYCFVEQPLLAGQYTLNAKRNFQHIVTGSAWCTEQMQGALYGSKGQPLPVTTICQGIDELFFKTMNRTPDDRFIVFSGGKAEFRKSQDIVIQAMAVFMGRHKDVYLNFAWGNAWQTPGYKEICQAMLLLDRTRTLGPGMSVHPVNEMRFVYRVADVSLFPNRCEAGTNLCLMESMACGIPAIATYATGHKDVLVDGDPLNLVDNKPLEVKGADGSVSGIWVEPSVDECIDKLEWAYQHREQLPLLGQRARSLMRPFTWKRCAEEFLKILEE